MTLLDQLDIAPRTKGRAARPFVAALAGELTQEDLGKLQGERGVVPPEIKELRDRHHALARLLADGASITEASLVTGYSSSRISILQNDPAFKALVADYKSKNFAAEASFIERTHMLSISAVNRLQDVVDSEEAVAPSTLLEIAKFSADRTGHAPVAKSVNLNIHTGLGDRLKSARERAQRAALPPPDEAA